MDIQSPHQPGATLSESCHCIDEAPVLSEAIECLHQVCMEQSGSTFLNSAMYHFSRLLGADYVVTGHPVTDGEAAIQTRIVLQRGVVIPNMKYQLKGTPCEIVMNRLACVYPERVAELFPDDKFFRDYNIEGYVGAPIVDPRGNFNGLVVALTRTPIQNPTTAITLAKLFAIAVLPQFVAPYQR